MISGLVLLRGYRRSWLRGDLIAGVTVATYLIPQVMAYAAVAGVDPVAGLWAALPAMAIYAALGYALFRLLEGWARRGGLQEAY